MSKIFIGGSRHVSRLGAPVHSRLDTIIEKSLPVIVGDATGADKAVQQYLATRSYDSVEVFCSGTVCRNNVGSWKTRQIETDPRDRGFRFYATKDREMAREADFGFMVWDGKSTGTLLNVLRLLRQDKKVVVYSVPDQKFAELKAFEQWDGFIANYSADVRREAEQKAALEDRTYGKREMSGRFVTAQA
jgi:adenine-specific DNA-methyltransferase